MDKIKGVIAMAHGIDVTSLNRFNPTSALINSQSGLNNSSMSWMNNLGDLKMIQSGTYKRTLASVYAKQDEDEVKESVSNAISSANTSNDAVFYDSNKEVKKADSGTGNTFEALL
ncbi:MAG: hypothetical protein K5639_04040 [Eubacterium sp.]|nr:hypothetical protein [Eubacterium sp.]